MKKYPWTLPEKGRRTSVPYWHRPRDLDIEKKHLEIMDKLRKKEQRKQEK